MWLRFLMSIVLCLRVTTVYAQDSNAEDDDMGLDTRRATPCETKDNLPGYCLPVVRCRRIMTNIRRFQNPNICFFQRQLPYVCCPVKLRSEASSISPVPRPTPTNRPTGTTRTTRTTRATTASARRNPPTNRAPATSNLQSAIDINPAGCGKRVYEPAQGTAFVVGGKEAPMYSWPWMAAIRSKTFGENTRFVCGGSLITRRHILTAAHCFGQGGGSRPPSDYKVVLGSHFRKSDSANIQEEPEEGAITVSIRALAVHDEYRDNGHDYDVAVMLLDADIIMTDHINPVCLPTRPGDRSDPEHVTVIGWGDLSFGGVGSKTLQEATFEVVPFNRCRRIFRQIPAFANGITSNMLCAGDLKGDKDACQNDSGGPLLSGNTDENKWTQVGVVSFGYRCAERGFPGVYARVTSFVSWIQRTVRRLR